MKTYKPADVPKRSPKMDGWSEKVGIKLKSGGHEFAQCDLYEFEWYIVGAYPHHIDKEVIECWFYLP